MSSIARITASKSHRYDLSRLSDGEVLDGTRRLVGASNQLFADLLAHLAEVESRGIHRVKACASLYTYCVYELRFSEDAAFRRVSAARFVKTFPVLFDAVARGELHLTGLLMIGPHLTASNQHEVLARAKHRTKKELAKLVRELDPLPDVPPRIAPLGPAPAPRSPLRNPTWAEHLASMVPVRHLLPEERPSEWVDEATIANAFKQSEGAGAAIAASFGQSQGVTIPHSFEQSEGAGDTIAHSFEQSEGATIAHSFEQNEGGGDNIARVFRQSEAAPINGLSSTPSAENVDWAASMDSESTIESESSGRKTVAARAVAGSKMADTKATTAETTALKEANGRLDITVQAELIGAAYATDHLEASPSSRRGIAPPQRLTGPQRYAVQFTASQEYVDLVQRAKDLLSHTGETSLEALHLRAMRSLVVQLEQRKFGASQRQSTQVAASDAPQPT